MAASTPKSSTCEGALDASVQDSADATVPNDGVSQSASGSGEADAQDAGAPDASDVDAQDAGAPDASEADAQDAGAPDASEADAQDAGAPDAGGLCKPTFPPSTLVLFGGEGVNRNLGDTWLWNGAAWTPVDAGDAVSPPPRQAAAMATACGYAVLMGGTGPVPIDGGFNIKGDAWLWDGSRWQPAPSAPAPRYAGAAATLGSTLYLFGGLGPGIDAMELGLLAWNGVVWSTPTQSSPSGPVPRLFPVVVSVGSGLLVFGGADIIGDVFPDTWLLTDTSWQLLDDGGADSGPALQAAGATSVDGSVVMFGGIDENCETLGDTWLWNGGVWSKVPAQGDGGPPPRAYPAMGTLNGQVVLFGGQDANNVPLGDTWLWDGGSWVRGPDAGPTPRTGSAMTAY